MAFRDDRGVTPRPLPAGETPGERGELRAPGGYPPPQGHPR
ncbi:hypothetical protein SBRY_60273 [Actinacidiphila bryophytorum]|uniref:Uncharacterized protein n=1 Tax=Actinacidiphila bryophytorum TaxID=1436133 RepID=A0A9W4H688_9ACTN|nr:hypothetical protein SBRY_60273 [Actinacidiphila bryophytorum]